MTSMPRPADRTRELVERALGEVVDGEDAIPTLSRAIAALRVEYGELDPDELDEGAGPVCTCPAELLARNGFRGSCPVHGNCDRAYPAQGTR